MSRNKELTKETKSGLQGIRIKQSKVLEVKEMVQEGRSNSAMSKAIDRSNED